MAPCVVDDVVGLALDMVNVCKPVDTDDVWPSGLVVICIPPGTTNRTSNEQVYILKAK